MRYEGKSAPEVQQALASRQIDGLSFHILRTRSSAGAEVEGVYVAVQDWNRLQPTELSLHMMQLTAAWSPDNPFASAANPALFNKHVGSSAWWTEITQRGAQARAQQFAQQWARQARAAQQPHLQFRLY